MRDTTTSNPNIWRRKPRQIRSINTTNVILEAAESVFKQKGFHNTRSEDIAERAGVGVSSIYDYFHNKTSIAMALMERAVFEILDDSRKAFLKFGQGQRELNESLPLVIEEIFIDYKKCSGILIDLANEVPELRNSQLYSIDRLMLQASHLYLSAYFDELDSHQFKLSHAFISLVFTASIKQYLTDPPAEVSERKFISELCQVILDYLTNVRDGAQL